MVSGQFLQAALHNNERFAYVVSGTWWTSTSKVYDERTTYPVHAGSVAVDKLHGIHWDGARTGEKEPAVLILVGHRPGNTTQGVRRSKPASNGSAALKEADRCAYHVAALCLTALGRAPGCSTCFG